MKTALVSLTLLIAVGACLAVCPPATADVPKTVTFQGRLADPVGKPVADGYYGIRFRIYDVETGGTPLWEKVKGVYVTGGVFDAVLGDETAIDLPFDRQYWIGIKVATDPDEVFPRVKLTSSPYAVNADRVDGFRATASPIANALLALNANAKLPTDITGDAATVGGFAASETPTANTILPLDAGAMFPPEVIPAVSDADKVDGFDASATPTPNTLLPLDAEGKFPTEVIPGSGDADTVDGFDASATPTPNTLLALDENAKLPADITGDAATVGGFAASGTPAANTLLPLDQEGMFPSEVIPSVSDADTVDGFDASAEATANTLLALNADAKLPASITGNANTVDGFDASATAEAGKLLALDANAKLPASITGDANTVDGFHASASPAANNLLPLNASTKFPNSVLNTGSGGGLDADMVDSKHATDFVQKTGAQTISGATTGYDAVLTVTNTSTGVGVKGIANSGGIGVRGEGTQFGVYGFSTDGYAGRFDGKTDGTGLGLYVKGSSYFTGYATFNGGKSGYVVDICMCADPGGLSSGDVVAIVGAAEPVVGDIPTMAVKKADSRGSVGVVGVVDKLYDGVSFYDSPIRRGDLLSVVTLGAYRWINAEATQSPIRPGDLLTSSHLPGFAKRATDAEPGTIVGKALDPLDSGCGKIRVFVSAR
jgi:hypothetical protein